MVDGALDVLVLISSRLRVLQQDLDVVDARARRLGLDIVLPVVPVNDLRFLRPALRVRDLDIERQLRERNLRTDLVARVDRELDRLARVRLINTFAVGVAVRRVGLRRVDHDVRQRPFG